LKIAIRPTIDIGNETLRTDGPWSIRFRFDRAIFHSFSVWKFKIKAGLKIAIRPTIDVGNETLRTDGPWSIRIDLDRTGIHGLSIYHSHFQKDPDRNLHIYMNGRTETHNTLLRGQRAHDVHPARKDEKKGADLTQLLLVFYL